MSDITPKTVVGYGVCDCGCKDVPFKISEKQHLYYICKAPADGGCGANVFARYRESDVALARRIKKFVKPEYRTRYLGELPEDEPEDELPEELQCEDATVPSPAQTPRRPASARKPSAKKPGMWFEE